LAARLPGVETLFLATVAAVAAVASLRPVDDPDFFWHYRVGQWIVERHAIPRQDLFTHTVPDHPFVAHEWLSEVLIYLLAHHLGFGAVAVFFGLVTWAGFMLVLATMRDAGFIFRGAALALGVIAAAPILGPRSQMLTFGLSALVLFLLRRYREGRGAAYLYVLPALFVLWVNLHAGFTFGLGLLVLYVLGECLTPARDRAPLGPLLAVAALCVVVVSLNPNFIGIYGYALQTQASPAQQQLIQEWHSPDFHLAELRGFEAMILLLAGLLAAGRLRPRWTDLLLLVTGTGLALLSVRHIALFVVLATPLLAAAGQGGWEAMRGRLRPNPPPRSALVGGVNTAILGVVLVTCAALAVPTLRSGPDTRLVRRGYPAAAIDAIASKPPPGRMFNLYEWGGYIAYRMPGQKVFIYGDAAVMGDDFLRAYQRIAFISPTYRQGLERYGVEWAIVRTSDPLSVILNQLPDWVSVHTDPVATVLVHRDAATEAYLAGR
jgi:hypothetical protein